MNNKIIIILLLSFTGFLMGCSDFFDVDTDNVLKGDDYIKEEGEMYTGYIGIMTKVQEIGDKSIYITDTRGELLEPTANSPRELISIYNYDDLTGNSYADPAPYYDVIIACNDYLSKMFEYKEKMSASINEDHFNQLVSCAIRVKVWVYLTMAKIYGEVVWFDDPITDYKDISNFSVSNIDDIIAKCKTLMETGLNGIPSNLDIAWKDYLDPSTATTESQYRYWDFMTPDYTGLYAELCLWVGDYQMTVNTILSLLNAKFASTTNDEVEWLRNANWEGGYSRIWDNSNKEPWRYETVSVITYNYQYNQTNRLLKHFGTEYPNEYLLRPSEVGIARFEEPLNNLSPATSDKRRGITARRTNGEWTINKFRPYNSTNRSALEDDVHIHIYRSADHHFMLAEALNNLGRFEEANAIINQGIISVFQNGGVTWEGFTDDWTMALVNGGTRKYGNAGIRGSLILGSRDFVTDPEVEQMTENEAIRFNDLAILDEMLLEFPCEGKTYPALIRMAKRYNNDWSIITDRVCPKYDNADDIRTKIEAGGYFVKWNHLNP